MTHTADHQHDHQPNRLLHETSPYLQQHAYNPVDWYPWGPEALEKARRENKPIFLSIGYSACHWCHVMEHESFEDPDIGRLMSENFVCIKVDREERPDLDQIYMTAVQMLTGHGGWPMSVFLTPDLRPFYGGTYWPPDDRMGMPGFRRVLQGVIDAWKNRRDEVEKSAGQVTENLRLIGTGRPTEDALTAEIEMQAVGALHRIFDQTHGGFGGAPKFPHAMDLKLLLRNWKRTGNREALHMVRLTLDKMAGGGIYDHLGGGFHRYSVDARWLVPHFEKMLYDNALLAQAYLEAYQATREPQYAAVARETLDYVLREMTDPEGGFYSTQDADSEGVEGKFFVWTLDEAKALLSEKLAKAFCYVYDVTEFGNWEGKSILNRPKSLEQDAKLLHLEPAELQKQLDEARGKLFEARKKRVPPGRDDKVIVAWNGLMIDAFAQAAQVLDEDQYANAASKAADFILEKLRREDGRLLHTYKDGQAKLDAYLDDYAFFANSLATLYETDFDPRWIRAALELTGVLCEHFWDDHEGGFFYTADDHEQLVTRTKDLIDSSIPSGNSMAALLLLRLGRLTGATAGRARTGATAGSSSSASPADLLEKAEAILKLLASPLRAGHTSGGQALVALDFYFGPTREFALVADPSAEETAAVLSTLRSRFLPNKVVALKSADTAAPEPLQGLFEGKAAKDNQPTIYICENFACQEPVAGAEALEQALNRLDTVRSGNV